MAEWNFDDFEESPDGGSVTQAVNWVGAVMSLVLIAGLATWGWQLLVRDVTGVPVVRALDGPMRIAPADPGGDAAAYQGLAVNSIAAEEATAARVEEVRLAPPPVELNDEDLAMKEMILIKPEVPGAETVEVVPAPVFGAEMQVAEAIEPEPAPSATDLAVAAALAGIDDIALVPASLTTSGPVFGPARTQRPAPRPARVQLASLSAPNTAILGERDPSTIALGARLVQLGAYGSVETARIEWANALSLFGDYMVGKERVIQEAESGGKTFYRLRAYGFQDLADARQFCSVLVAEGANCIPVVQQ